jgi:hypothetical protein
MADVIALIDDLFFLAKVRETAKHVGVTLETAGTGERLCAAGIAGNPRRVIAFLSHVQTDLANRAISAGCREVMPRSKFTQNLAEILRGAKA